MTLEQHLAAHAARRWDDGSENLECLCGWIVDYEEIDFGINETTPDVLVQEDAQHAAHVAATWREARTVRTAEELDALPAGSAIRSGECLMVMDRDKMWVPVWNGGPTSDGFLVLWTPEDGAA